MTISVGQISRCFEGEIPALLATAAADGTPNLGHISHVYQVDEQHVAISNQFLVKSAENLRRNPLATVLCTEPHTLNCYRLLVRHVRTEDSGPTFATVRRSVDAIAALTGMSDVFALRSVEVFRVLEVEHLRMRGTASDA